MAKPSSEQSVDIDGVSRRRALQLFLTTPGLSPCSSVYKNTVSFQRAEVSPSEARPLDPSVLYGCLASSFPPYPTLGSRTQVVQKHSTRAHTQTQAQVLHALIVKSLCWQCSSQASAVSFSHSSIILAPLTQENHSGRHSALWVKKMKFPKFQYLWAKLYHRNSVL